jgi:hypothetical protein
MGCYLRERKSLHVKAEIVEAANGSFYIAQMLAHQTCLDSGILQQQKERLATQISFELTRSKVFDRLSRTFLERTQKFSRGTRFRREGRAGIGCSRISGILSERLCALADMESAHGEPHIASDRASINAVIRFFPCWSDRCCHDGRCLSSQTALGR